MLQKGGQYVLDLVDYFGGGFVIYGEGLITMYTNMNVSFLIESQLSSFARPSCAGSTVTPHLAVYF